MFKQTQESVSLFFFLATVDYVFEEGVINTAHLDTHSSTPVLIFE